MLTTYPIIHINVNSIHAKKRISIQGRAPPLNNFSVSIQASGSIPLVEALKIYEIRQIQ